MRGEGNRSALAHGEAPWIGSTPALNMNGERDILLTPHPRGNSYLRIGWNWVKGVLHQGWRLFPSLSMRGQANPNPAVASKKQTQKQL